MERLIRREVERQDLCVSSQDAEAEDVVRNSVDRTASVKRSDYVQWHLDDVYEVEEVAEDGVLHGTPDYAVVGQGEPPDEPVRRQRPVQIGPHEDHAGMHAGVWRNLRDDLSGVDVGRL